MQYRMKPSLVLVGVLYFRIWNLKAWHNLKFLGLLGYGRMKTPSIFATLSDNGIRLGL